MLPEFLYPMVRYFTPFNVFQYITFRAAYAAITSLLICFIFGPAIIRFLQRREAGESIRADGPESHSVKAGTPTMGGLMIILAIVVSSILWMDISTVYTWVALLSVVGFGLLGFVDDWLKTYRKQSGGMEASVKFIGQIVLALTVSLFLYLHGTEYATLLYIPSSSSRCWTSARSTFPLVFCCSWVPPTRLTSPTVWTAWRRDW